MNGVAELISIHDADFTIVKVNRALSLVAGKEPEELIGRKCYEVIHGTTEPPAACPHAAAMAQGRTCTSEWFEALLGIYVRASASPIFDASCKPVATLHVIEKRTRPAETREGPEKQRVSSRPSGRGSAPLLTPRQKQVLQLLCEGRSAKEIAFRLNISTRTVEFHKRQMIENLGTKTLAGLIRYAVTNDIVD